MVANYRTRLTVLSGERAFVRATVLCGYGAAVTGPRDRECPVEGASRPRCESRDSGRRALGLLAPRRDLRARPRVSQPRSRDLAAQELRAARGARGALSRRGLH